MGNACNKRIQYFDCARGIAMILVVASHIWVFTDIRYILFATTHNPTFFLVSGCLLVGSLTNKNRGGGTLAWAGEHSLEVYLTHYLLLSLIKSDKVPILYSPVGLSLVLVNYVITVALTVMAIVMMNQNAVLRFVLFGKKK